MRNKMLALLIGLFLMSGCGGADTSLDDQGDTLIGGTPTTGYPGIGVIFAKKPDSNEGALCTGTFITDTAFLVAAHCLHPGTVGDDVEFHVFEGYDLTNADTTCPCHTVKEVHYHPGFDPNNPSAGYDIGLAIVNEPTDVRPIPYMQSPMTNDMVGQPATLVGYGVNNGWNNKGAGIKREITVKLNSYNDKFVKTGGWGKTMCSGDSGGPVLMDVDGVQTVVGVNSFGMIFCLFEGTSTRVDAYLDVLEEWLPSEEEPPVEE